MTTSTAIVARNDLALAGPLGSLDAYLDRVSRIPVLGREEERELAERFRGQLSFQIDVEPGLELAQVPRLLLQPLVENAMRHGLREGRGWLQVDVRRKGPRLQYTVSDDGAGLPDTPVSPGTGLSNISRRLELLFPGAYTFNLAARVPRGAVVTIDFPIAA